MIFGIPNGATALNRADLLVKSFQTSIYSLLAKIGFDTAENEPFNFHNSSSLHGLDFHRAVVSQPALSASGPY